MAAHLTDEQKKKIIADYMENGSYRATAKMNNVSAPTVKKVVNSDAESLQKFAQKKEQNTLDMLAYMDSRNFTVNISDCKDYSINQQDYRERGGRA